MSKKIRLKKGLNINLIGEADKVYASVDPADRYIIKPTDFHGLIPKLVISDIIRNSLLLLRCLLAHRHL